MADTEICLKYVQANPPARLSLLEAESAMFEGFGDAILELQTWQVLGQRYREIESLWQTRGVLLLRF